MSAALAPFANGEFAITVTEHAVDGFRVQAPGLARALGFAEARDMLRAIPDEEKGSELSPTPGGEQRIGYVTEAGFYRALGQRQAARISDDMMRDQVERFQTWVYREVLPTIRRTGSYSVAPVPTEIDATMLRQIAAAMEAKDAEIAALTPRAEVADRFLATADSSRLVGQVAKEMALTERNLRQFLCDEKLIFSRTLPCGHRCWDFYTQFRPHFEATETTVDHGDGRIVAHYTLRITPRGVELIAKRLASYRAALAGVAS